MATTEQQKQTGRGRRQQKEDETIKGDVEGSASSSISEEEQQDTAAELTKSMAQREDSIAAMQGLQEAVEKMPERTAIATATAVAEALGNKQPTSGPTKEETKSAVKEGTKEAAEEAADETRSRARRVAISTYRMLKPRRPRREDVAPAVWSNVGTWGTAMVLSQISGGASEFFVGLFEQTPDIS